MNDHLATLNGLVTALSGHDKDQPLIFSTDAGDISPGYHVTELKRISIHSIDCGGRLSDWTETQMQLLDGIGRDYMSVAKFVGIAKRSITALNGLSDSPLSVEFAPGNRGLRRYLIADLHEGTAGTRVKLVEDGAACKPQKDATSECYTAKAACC